MYKEEWSPRERHKIREEHSQKTSEKGLLKEESEYLRRVTRKGVFWEQGKKRNQSSIKGTIVRVIIEPIERNTIWLLNSLIYKLST